MYSVFTPFYGEKTLHLRLNSPHAGLLEDITERGRDM